MMLYRRFSLLAPRLKSLDPLKLEFVKSCPQPTYDTGCTYCQPQLSYSKQIDYNRPLRSSKLSIWKHLLILDETDPKEWKSKIELDHDSFVLQIARFKRKLSSPHHPVLVNNVHFQSYNRTEGVIKMILYPDNIIIEVPTGFITDDGLTEKLIRDFLTPSDGKIDLDANVKVSPHANRLVLVCGHSQRDERCGKMAPLLINEFSHVLSDKGIDDVEVGTITHVGGHLFAGNVIYFNADGESIWYGRVHPENVQGIVQETIINDHVIEELYRG